MKSGQINIFLVLLLGLTTTFVSCQQGRVLLRDVQAITLRRGEKTTGRRSSPVPQLQCSGGTAYGKYAPKVVQCYNRGFDGNDVQWECQAEMSSDYQLGKIDVTCEGYEYPNDPFILAGSCGLNYELDYSSSGAKRGAYNEPSAPYDEEGKGINFVKIVYFGIAAFVIYLIYTSLTAPRQGAEGISRGGGSSGGGGYPPDDGHGPGGQPYPPGWRPPPPPPSYDETYGPNKGGRNPTAPPSSSSSSNGPGFMTGLGMGALGGYLFGNQGSGGGGWGTGWGNGARRRNYGGGSYYGDSNYNEDGPSTSGGYRGGGGGSSYSSSSGGGGGSHTSSGFGGTSRR